MSTNHNRIRVADLETNEPNKILKTNQNGELEFSDANNLQTENYNGLDYTKEGKALDARQGKVLKDMMDKSTIVGTNYVNKSSFGTKKIIDEGDLLLIDVSTDKTKIILTKNTTFLRAIAHDEGSNYLYQGRDLYIKNEGHIICQIVHLFTGDSNYKFSFPDGKNFNLKPNEQIHFKLKSTTENIYEYVGISPSDLLGKQNISEKGTPNGYVPLDNAAKINNDYLYIVNDLNEGGEQAILSAEQGKVLRNMIENTSTSPVSLVNDLTTGGTNKALTAEMGKTLENTKLTGTIATDADLQVPVIFSEDKKMISRFKLFNWWNWIRANAIKLNNTLTLNTGTATTPPLIISNGTLTTSLKNGAFERDENGSLWETHSNLRSQIITTEDGVITIPYKSNSNVIQTNIDTYTSGTTQQSSSSTTIGKINNYSVLRLNMFNFLTNRQVGNVKPTVAKVEVFLKLENGVFAKYFEGSSPTNQIKLLEYSGNMAGAKNYQNPIIMCIQDDNPLVAQWSSIDIVEETVIDNNSTFANKTYYLRDSLNRRALGAVEASFKFVFVNTLIYADGENLNGKNANTMLRNDNHAIYIEKIK